MKYDLILGGRQTGKTEALIKLLRDSSGHIMFISPNHRMMRNAIEKAIDELSRKYNSVLYNNLSKTIQTNNGLVYFRTELDRSLPINKILIDDIAHMGQNQLLNILTMAVNNNIDVVATATPKLISVKDAPMSNVWFWACNILNINANSLVTLRPNAMVYERDNMLRALPPKERYTEYAGNLFLDD